NPDDQPSVETIAPNQRFALLAVSRIIPPSLPPFDTVKAQAKADLIRELSLQRAKAAAEQIATKANSGTPFAQAAAQSGLALPPIKTVTAKRIEIAQARGEVPPPVKLMFGLARGKTRILPIPGDAGYFVVHLDQVVPGNVDESPTLVTLMRNELNDVVGPEY